MAYEGSNAGALLSGFASGTTTGKALDTQWDANRARKAAAAAIPTPAGQPPHQSLVDNLKGHVEDFTNRLLGTHFGNQPPPVTAPPQVQAPVVAPPGAAPVAIPAPGVAPPPVAMAQPQPMPVAPGMVPQPQRPMMMARGGVVEGYAEGGSVSGYEGSNAGAAMSGFASGLDTGRTLADQYNHKKADDAAADAAVPADASSSKISVKDHIENFAHHLFGMGLSDNHVRNSQQALSSPTSGPAPSSPGSSAVPAGPSPAPPATPAQTPSAGAPSPAAAPAAAGASSGAADPTASGGPEKQQITKAVIANAAADPAAKQGIPQKTPAQSGHSLSHVDWEQSDALMAKAVRAAARAGEDPSKAYESLNNTRMAFMQSSVLRNIGAANMALMNGDSKAVEQAIRNVNYYMPNGQDLDIQHAPDGTLEVRDPFASPGPDGKQPVVPITAQHLQLMAQNAMDPMKVQDIINAAHTQGAKIAHEQQQDKVMLMGALAKNADANTRALLAPALIQLYKAHAGYFAGRLAAEGTKAARLEADKNKVPFAVAQKAASEGTNAVLLMSQGLQDTAPIMDSQGNPSLSPAAGKQYRNVEKIPSFLTGVDGKVLSPSDVAGVASLAGSIAAANVGRGMSGPAAAELAGNIYKATHAKKMPTHPGKDGKPEANVKLSADGTIGWIWQQGASPKDGTWRQFNLHAEVGNAISNGTDQAVPIPDESDPSMEFPTNPADNEPAVPAPSNY